MRYSSTYHVLVLISNHAMKMSNPGFNPFDDKWIDGIFYYTGEGNIDDQPNPPTRQNKRLMNQDYYACYLFEVFRQGEFTYQGRVDLAKVPLYGGEHSRGRQPDKNGNMRDVWIFPMKRINETGLRKDKFLGAIGTAMTDLKPTGIIAAKGEHVPATADGKFIDKDATVKVVEVIGSKLIVSKISGW